MQCIDDIGRVIKNAMFLGCSGVFLVSILHKYTEIRVKLHKGIKIIRGYINKLHKCCINIQKQAYLYNFRVFTLQSTPSE